MIRRKHFAFQAGYAFWCDLQYGFTLCLFGRRHIDTGSFKSPRYKFILEVGWNWLPTIVYNDPNWHLNEKNMLKGLPIPRMKPLRRPTIRRIFWSKAARWSWTEDDEHGASGNQGSEAVDDLRHNDRRYEGGDAA